MSKNIRCFHVRSTTVLICFTLHDCFRWYGAVWCHCVGVGRPEAHHAEATCLFVLRDEVQHLFNKIGIMAGFQLEEFLQQSFFGQIVRNTRSNVPSCGITFKQGLVAFKQVADSFEVFKEQVTSNAR